MSSFQPVVSPHTNMACDKYGETLNAALRHAVERDDAVAVARLLECGADPNAENPAVPASRRKTCDESPFRNAVLRGNVNIVKYLLAAGGDVFARKNEVIVWAVTNSRYDLLRALIEHAEKKVFCCDDHPRDHGVRCPEYRKAMYLTAFRMAIMNGDLPCVTLMIDAGLAPLEDESCVADAVLRRNVQVALLLLHRGASKASLERSSLSDTFARTLLACFRTQVHVGEDEFSRFLLGELMRMEDPRQRVLRVLSVQQDRACVCVMLVDRNNTRDFEILSVVNIKNDDKKKRPFQSLSDNDKGNDDVSHTTDKRARVFF